MSVRDFVLSFGKYKGDSLEEIFVKDKDYLEWVFENIERDDIQNKIEQLYEEMKNVRIY